MKVLITTSGIGQRLGNLTKATNKSLMPVGDKPALSRIIDSYPKGTEFVITLGYKAEIVAQFLEIAYEELPITTVMVENFNGPGSSLARSMLEAKSFLCEPFIFNAGDSIVSFENRPPLDKNWLAASSVGDPSLYAAMDIYSGKVTAVLDKGADRYDFLYPGVAGIVDHEEFWTSLAEKLSHDPLNSSLNDLTGIQSMMEKKRFEPLYVSSWHDVGSVAGLVLAQNSFENKLPTLTKEEEAIYKVGGKVVKFFANEEMTKARVDRASKLHPTVPEVKNASSNFYSYQFVDGKPMSDSLTPAKFRALLNWAQGSLWSQNKKLIPEQEFSTAVRNFYFDKTSERGKTFLRDQNLPDAPSVINSLPVAKLEELLTAVKKTGLIRGRQGLFHGDFVLDNIIEKDEGGFVAIDWRQDFAGYSDSGDVLYDLAKLNHSLTMNHDILNAGQYVARELHDGLFLELHRLESHVECSSILTEFCDVMDVDFREIEILTAMIWISMAPLHGRRVGHFLYNFGKYTLAKVLMQHGSGTDISI